MKKILNDNRYALSTAFLSLMGLSGFAYYGLPFFFDFMIEDFGYTRAEVTSGFAVAKIIVAPLFGFLAGWLIDRFGPRRLMMLGALLIGIAFVGLAHSAVLWMFYLFYVFKALSYVFGGPLPCQVLISRRFRENRGKAMGVAYLGIGVGGAIVPLIATNLEKYLGWQTALMALGVIIFLITFPMPFFMKKSVNSAGEDRRKEEEAPPMKSILKNPNFYLLAFGSLCSIGAVGGMGQHLKLYLRDLEFSQAQAAHIMSLVLLSSLVGRLFMGWLADTINRKYVMLLIYTIVGSAIFTLLLPPFPGRIYVFAVAFGLGIGGDYMIIPLTTADHFGVRALGRTMGIILVADGVAEAVFPVVVSLVHNDEVGYRTGFTILLCVALAGAVIISFLPKLKQKAHER